MIYGSAFTRNGTMGNGGGTDVPTWVYTATNSEADAQKVFNYFKSAGRSDIDSLILAMQEPDMRKLVLDILLVCLRSNFLIFLCIFSTFHVFATNLVRYPG